jgi:hypothetical protein
MRKTKIEQSAVEEDTLVVHFFPVGKRWRRRGRKEERETKKIRKR